MLDYIYYAVAAIVLVGIAIGVVALMRKRGGDDLEGMTSAVPADDADLPAEDSQQGVEHLLADWRAENGRPHSNGQTGAQPDTLDPDAGTGAAAAAAGAATAGPGAAAGSAAFAAQPSQTLTLPQLAPAGLLADPLGAVIADMADGKGRLSGQELKRLEVFRPERIQTATQTVQLPPRLEGDDAALMRLAQIKLYAATLELRTKWASQMAPGADAGLPDVPFTARDFKLKMARDIMALPAGDRSEVIGFLLGGLLNSKGSSPQLKRAVIDTLEQLRSASLVNVLLDCLDDPDPIVQDYALAAADRLLDGA